MITFLKTRLLPKNVTTLVSGRRPLSMDIQWLSQEFSWISRQLFIENSTTRTAPYYTTQLLRLTVSSSCTPRTLPRLAVLRHLQHASHHSAPRRPRYTMRCTSQTASRCERLPSRKRMPESIEKSLKLVVCLNDSPGKNPLNEVKSTAILERSLRNGAV